MADVHPTIGAQWQLYLHRAGLHKSQMGEFQYQETRRAFFAACGQMLLVFRDEITEFPDDEAVLIMDELINEVNVFWLREANSPN